MTLGAIDTDAIYKATVYGFLNELIDCLPNKAEEHCILEAAKYVIKNKLKKHPPNKGVDLAIEALNDSLTSLKAIEPTNDEIKLAASLEYEAQQRNMEFDSGESLLCAALIKRPMLYVITGDKRAINAAEYILPIFAQPEMIESKLICLEQSIKFLLDEMEPSLIRENICSEPELDKALTICFSCKSKELTYESWILGLDSYINNLKKSAPNVLY